jgi:hypothetical protein
MLSLGHADTRCDSLYCVREAISLLAVEVRARFLKTDDKLGLTLGPGGRNSSLSRVIAVAYVSFLDLHESQPSALPGVLAAS